MITERPQINGKDGSMLLPYEVVLTCTGTHKNLDIADWQENKSQKLKNKVSHDNRRTKRILG